MKKTIKIMLSLVIVLAIMLTTVTTCFAANEETLPFQAEVYVNGNSIGICDTISQFNQILSNHPGKGNMVVEVKTYARRWDFKEQIVIPEKAEYHISFKAPTQSGMCFYEGGCFKVEADNVTLDFEGCKIYWYSGNKGNYGGLMYVTGDNFSLKNLKVRYTSATYGGAVYTEGKNTTIENCEFEDCSATVYGGAIYADNYRCRIKNCTFINCTAKGNYAGAVFLNYGGLDKTKDGLAEINDCHFKECDSAKYGEALFLGGDYTHVNDCEFYYTTVTDDICYIGNDANVDVRFTGCNFHDNFHDIGCNEFVDIWGTRYTTQIVNCTSDNPNKDRFYHCDLDPDLSGATISEGNIWVIIIGAVVIVGALAAVIVVKKKRKPKRALR